MSAKPDLILGFFLVVVSSSLNIIKNRKKPQGRSWVPNNYF